MRRGWQIAGACLFALFGFALVLSLEYSLSDALGPGPGFFPFWLSAVGLALCAVVVVQAFRSNGESDAASILPGRAAAWRLGRVAIALAAAAALLEPLGFRLTMLLFVTGLLLALGARSPVAVGLTAVLGSFGVFHVFYYWLKVPLPIGALGV